MALGLISNSVTRGGSKLLLANAAFIIWSVCFIALYAAVGLGCALDLNLRPLGPSNLLTAILLAIWLIYLAPLAWLLSRTLVAASHKAPESAESFLARLTRLLTVSGLVATLYIGAPILFLRPCP